MTEFVSAAASLKLIVYFCRGSTDVHEPVSLFAGIHANININIYVAAFLSVQGGWVGGWSGVGWFHLLSTITKLCSVNLLYNAPKLLLLLLPCSLLLSRTFFFFQPICCDHNKHSSKRISKAQSARGHMHINARHTQLLLLLLESLRCIPAYKA